MSLLEDNSTPADIMLKAIAEKPYAQFRQGYTWHIANLTAFDSATGYFAIGRTTPTSIPKLDQETGDFVDTEDDTSPYTYVVYDAGIGLMAIQRESELVGVTEEIATKIQRLLNNTQAVRSRDMDVRIQAIPDPTDFIAKIENAYAIKKFTATFTGPNPIDADELFQKPLSVYLKATNGTEGAATVESTHLNSEVVSAVARSTAATGNSASARIQEVKGKRAIKINLGGDPVKLPYEADEVDPKVVLEDAQAAYQKVRHEGS